jgi:hypothetical protein
MALTESQLNVLIEQRAEKKKKGGPRPNSGRPKKMTEEQLMEKLWPMSDLAFRVLEKKLGDGNEKALQIYFNYFVGMPTQKIENKIEGNLNQVQIEVVKPNVEILEAATN